MSDETKPPSKPLACEFSGGTSCVPVTTVLAGFEAGVIVFVGAVRELVRGTDDE